MESMGQTLKMKFGPLPVWAWAVILIGAFWWYSRRKSKQSAESQTAQNTQGVGQSTSAFSTVPISTLVVQPQPMPMINHDGGQNVGQNTGTNSTTDNSFSSTGGGGDTLQPAGLPAPQAPNTTPPNTAPPQVQPAENNWVSQNAA